MCRTAYSPVSVSGSSREIDASMSDSISGVAESTSPDGDVTVASNVVMKSA